MINLDRRSFSVQESRNVTVDTERNIRIDMIQILYDLARSYGASFNSISIKNHAIQVISTGIILLGFSELHKQRKDYVDAMYQLTDSNGNLITRMVSAIELLKARMHNRE